MDKVDRAKKLDWSWLQQFMPELVREIGELRAAGLGPHVDRCWRLGVLEGQPGYFYAREGAVAVGTPFERDSPELKGQARRTFKVLGYWLQIAPVEVRDGA